jgi:hypothetical protein
MYKFILILTIILFVHYGFAQKTKNEQEKPPTQAEMQEMLEEFQNMSEEDKKELEKLSVKIPILIDIPQLSNAKLADAWEHENRLIPVRNVAKNTSILKYVPLERMEFYINAVQKLVSESLENDEKEICTKSFNYIQTLSKNNIEQGNMAMGFWLAGKPKIALHTLGQVLLTSPKDDNNLSNYASMLSLLGGQHLSIPILNNLNSKYPNNSTILNNLAQAWFGLGEVNMAEQFLDLVLLMSPKHPQATFTKAIIEESKGNTVNAIKYIKTSIQAGYSTEKENKLEKLGSKLTLNDVTLPFKPGPDPLSLGSIHRPDYPTNLSELKRLKPEWEKFNEACDVKLNNLQLELTLVGENYSKDLNKLAAEDIKVFQQGNPLSKYTKVPLLAKKATLAMNEAQRHFDIRKKHLTEEFIALTNDLSKIKNSHKRAVPEASCKDQVEVENNYLKKYNERKKIYDEEFLTTHKQYLNEIGYWSQFTSLDKNIFETIRIQFLIDWLLKNKEYQPLLYSEYESFECVDEYKNQSQWKLSEFDKVACKYNDTLDLKIIKFYNNCSRMTSKLDLKFLEITRLDNFERAIDDEYESCTIKINAEKDIGTFEKGPLKIEATAGASIEFELDREGIKDVITTAGAEAQATVGPNVGKKTVDVTIGIEGKISLISGKTSITASSKINALSNSKIVELN